MLLKELFAAFEPAPLVPQKTKRNTPSKTRPVRPFLWSAEALDDHVRTRAEVCRRGSYTSCRRIPKSITTLTRGSVSDDSAMLEAKTTWTVSIRSRYKSIHYILRDAIKGIEPPSMHWSRRLRKTLPSHD